MEVIFRQNKRSLSFSFISKKMRENTRVNGFTDVEKKFKISFSPFQIYLYDLVTKFGLVDKKKFS